MNSTTQTSVKRTIRSHTCGELNESHVGQEVMLTGWVNKRRDHGGVIFVDMRDRYGITQVVFDPEIAGGKAAHEFAARLRSEFVFWCKGKVRRRPEGMKNPKMVTGGIEVACDDLVILSEAKTPPFPIEEDSDVAETVRLKYRYLDLRRPEMQRSMLIRHRAVQAVRKYLDEQGFIDIETPILYKSTPEGARDFIVPSRLNPGTFYALPQSPQTLKQLLMVSGMDRYYQIARCFRDEDLRADRQPEFSQIDMEVSFMDMESFFPLIEGMIKRIWKETLNVDLKTPFPRMPFSEAMSRFGSDKPDVRFGLELIDLSDVFSGSTFKVFQGAFEKDALGKPGSVRGIHVQGKAEKFSRKDLDDVSAVATRNGAKGLLWIKVQENGELQSPAAKFFSDAEKKALSEKMGLKAGDLVLIVADRNKVVFDALGSVRLELGARLGLIPSLEEGARNPAFLWVVGFPLLEYDPGEKRYFACHHPFTAPIPEQMEWLVKGENLADIQAAAYDVVANGMELGGGSMRIYRSDVQNAMFKALGLSEEEANDKFGFFMEALQYGTPPHGGIAFGVDRLAATLAAQSAIRDVMAFPKTQKGHCMMSESPSAVSRQQLSEVGVMLTPTAAKSVEGAEA